MKTVIAGANSCSWRRRREDIGIMDVKAYAKINLALDVTGKRSDGYHTVDMIMQTVALHDDIHIELDGTGNISLLVKDERASGKAAGEKPAPIPADEKNLMVKAAGLMKAAFNIKNGLRMSLVKRIPSEAGLGGGSADAAAVINAVNALTGFGAGDSGLFKLAEEVGADVPFLLKGGTARAEGIGTKLTFLEPLSDMPGLVKGNGACGRNAYGLGRHVLIVKPAAGCSTPAVYKAYDEAADRLGEAVRHPNIQEMSEAIELLGRLRRYDFPEKAADSDEVSGGLCGKSHDDRIDDCICLICQNSLNVLEYPVRESFIKNGGTDIVGIIKNDMIRAGAAVSCMSGSGTAVYGIFKSDETLKYAAETFKNASYKALLSDIIETVFV